MYGESNMETYNTMFKMRVMRIFFITQGTQAGAL